MARQNLSELEQLIMLALLQMGGEGHGAGIRATLRTRIARSVTPGAIYPALDRLEARGLLRSRLGDPTPERGGRAKRHFKVTSAGLREARRAWHQTATLASGLSILKTRRDDV